jgi:hypothetical protein
LACGAAATLGFNGEGATAVLFLASSYCCNASDLHGGGKTQDAKCV